MDHGPVQAVWTGVRLSGVVPSVISMTWTGAEAPHEGAPAAAGLDGTGGGGAPWQGEPLAPGALGADPTPGSGGAGAPLPDLPPPPLTGPLAEALAAARSAADGASRAARHLASTGPRQRVQALQETARLRHVTDAVLLALTASSTPEDLTTVGATSPTDLLLTHTGADPRRATGEVHLAKALTAPVAPLRVPLGDPGAPADAAGPDVSAGGEGLGRVGEQHAAGAISTDVASLARRTVESLPRRIQRASGAQADALLAERLPGLTHPEAVIACTVLAHTLDSDRADRGFDPDDVDRRHLTITVHDDGSVDVRGHLDAITGAEFKAAIDHLSKPDPSARALLADAAGTPGLADEPLPGLGEPDTDEGAGADEGTGAGTGTGTGRQGSGRRGSAVRVRDPRTPGQRRADALAQLTRLGRTGDETRGGEPPRIIVTATADQLAGVPGAGLATCETTRRPLTTTQLQHLACTALLHAVTLSCQGPQAAALALGRTVRLFSPAQRRAMLARDGGCVIPGCTAPPGWLEAHHVHDWAEDGPTDVDLGVLLCGRHHLLVTLGVWAVRVVGGVPQVRPPATVDPLQRWLLNPRRAVAHSTARRAEQLLLPSPHHVDDHDHDDGRVPDIPSPRSTCAC